MSGQPPDLESTFSSYLKEQDIVDREVKCA